jgi:hypothetical protein
MLKDYSSFRFHGKKPVAIRCISPGHNGGKTTASRDYLNMLLQKAEDQGFNQFVLESMDGGELRHMVLYKDYPKVAEMGLIDVAAVKKRIDLLKWFCDEAGKRKMEVLIWHHEMTFPSEFWRAYPEAFHLDKIHDFAGDLNMPTPNLKLPFLWDFMRNRLREAFDNAPGLTGIVLTVQESDIAIYHLGKTETENVALARRLYETIDEVHTKEKKWYLRSFAWRECEYEIFIKAIDGFNPKVPLMMKNVPMDWHLFYPHDKYISRVQGRNLIVEMDIGGNFWGECELPAVSAEYQAKTVRHALSYGALGFVLRVDRDFGHTYDKPMELQHRILGKLFADPGLDLNLAFDDCITEQYDERVIPEIRELCRIGQAVVERTYYVKGTFFFHHNYWTAINGCCNLYVALRDELFEPGDESWREELEYSELLLSRTDAILHEIERKLGRKLGGTTYKTALGVYTPIDRWAELKRQFKNLKDYFAFFSALKDMVYTLKCYLYDKKNAALKKLCYEKLGILVEARKRNREFTPGVDVATSFKKIIEEGAPRDIIEGITFSEGAAFAGKSYQTPFPEPITCSLPVRKGATNILVVFMGSHSCRKVSAQVTVNGETFQVDKGTMSWFLGYDGYRRAEVILPEKCCRTGRIAVKILAGSCESAPHISEVRVETEGDGYKPRLDV